MGRFKIDFLKIEPQPRRRSARDLGVTTDRDRFEKFTLLDRCRKFCHQHNNAAGLIRR